MMGKFKKIWQYIAALIVPAACFWLLESFTYIPSENMSGEAQFLNILFYYIVFFILYGITGSIGIGLMIESVLVLILGLANYYVIQFRSSPILPWDILSIKTALSVSDNYTFELPKEVIVIIIKFCILFIIGATAYVKKSAITKAKIIQRVSFVVVGIFMIFGLTKLVQQESVIEWADLNTTLFTPGIMCRDNGFAVTFMMDMQYMKINPPSGYSRSETKKELKKYEGDTEEKENLPNIIVIMDECFSDPAVLTEFNTNTDYMPFVHRMQLGNENTVTGNLHVSVLGGNTANTEFEFLTGNTMAFLPGGSIPYQQYISGEIPSLVSWLNELGYTTNAIHPYYDTGWNRDKVYPYLGFQNMYFNTSFDSDAEIIRKYISDAAAFDKVLELQKEQDGPSFTFLVTMQNHGGFGPAYEGFNPDIRVFGTDSKYPINYLSLMKITDNSLKEFIKYLSSDKEDTVVVFFGDHQPNDIIVNPLLGLEGKSCESLSKEEIPLRYEVPYLVWANFKIDEAMNIDTSPNYLGAQVLRMCGIPTSDYQNYLLELSEQIPVISTQYTVDDMGNEPDKELLTSYKKMQYYRLFDYND